MRKEVVISAGVTHSICSTVILLVSLVGGVALGLPPAGPHSLLYSFRGGPLGDGETPLTSLTLKGSTLFGTTYGGGTANNGTVFRIGTDGSNYTRLHEFSGREGRLPNGRLLSVGTTLYGTTEIGGTFSRGTVYKVEGDGTGFQVL